VATDVFRPQSVGRAVRTAFVLGILLVVGVIAAVGAFHEFNSLVGPNTKDELSRYLEDHQHWTASPSDGDFEIQFPVPADRETEKVSTGLGTVTAPRDTALVDDEITFDVEWLDLPSNRSAASASLLNTFVSLQIHQHQGTKVAVDPQGKFQGTIFRDFVYKNVDSTGTTHYFDERLMMKDRRIWIVRVGSRVRRDEAFRVFAASFTFRN